MYSVQQLGGKYWGCYTKYPANSFLLDERSESEEVQFFPGKLLDNL